MTLAEALERELTDRLQHPETFTRATKEALVDQRCERVQICVADGFGRPQRAAAGEDGQTREQGLLVRGQKVEAPADRRPEGLLPGIGVTHALEEIEPLGEAAE